MSEKVRDEKEIWEEGNENYLDNAPLDAAYLLFASEKDEDKRAEAFLTFLNILAKRISEEAYVPMPFVDVNNVLLEGIDVKNLKEGDTISTKQGVRLRMDSLVDKNDKQWLPLFINDRERYKGQTANIILPVAIYDVLRIGMERDDLMGVVVNPFGKAFTFRKDLLERFLNDYEAWAKASGIQVPGANSMFAAPEGIGGDCNG